MDAESVLTIARNEIGYSSVADPECGTKYGRWYGERFGAEFAAQGVPWCAMFVSWVFDRAGATCAGLPSAWCPGIAVSARAYGAALDNVTAACPGDVALFDWECDGTSDHIGIVERVDPSGLMCIEGNVSGKVGRRWRTWPMVCLVIRPSSYTQSHTSSSSPEDTIGAERVVVDGQLGRYSVSEWAQQLGLTGSSADGWIHHQYAGNQPYLSAFTSVIYDYYRGCSPSPTALAIQKRINVSNLDGVLGKVDIIALQRFLNQNGEHLLVDGVAGWYTAQAVQRSLNAGLWR